MKQVKTSQKAKGTGHGTGGVMPETIGPRRRLSLSATKRAGRGPRFHEKKESPILPPTTPLLVVGQKVQKKSLLGRVKAFFGRGRAA